MPTLLFYKKPVPLNRDTHRHLLLEKATSNYDFAKATNSVPLAAIEFTDASRDYPIVFAGDEAGGLFPAALLGMRKDENLFFSEKNGWEARYIPAFIRRYPFVLAEKQADGALEVYIDEAYAGFGAKGGDRLFTDSGDATPVLKQALDFLSNYQGEIARTRKFMDRLQELKLLTPKVLQVERKNEAPLVLQGFSVVDEQILAKLDDAQIGELLRNGFLSLIYAHLMSLGNILRLETLLNSRPAKASAKQND